MQNLTIRLLPFLLVAMLAIYVSESEAKTCKAKSHKNVKASTVNKAVKQDDSSKSSKSSSSSSSSSSSGSKAKANSGKHVSTTPSRGKSGVAGGQSINFLKPGTLSWYTDWSPSPATKNDKGIELASMLWGLGKASNPSDHDAERFAAFKKLTPGQYKYVIGFNEPDFSGDGSSGYFSPSEGASAWDQYIAPHGEAGSILISPSMAKQADETWLKPFLSQVKRQPDAIGVHIFQNDPSKVGRILDHFAQYNKPMWITETACINYQNGAHDYCSQEQSDNYIATVIDMFEKDDRVAAYAISDAYNGDNMALTPDHNGSKLSSAGQTFKASIAKYASKRSFDETIDNTAKFVKKSLGSKRHHAHAQHA